MDKHTPFFEHMRQVHMDFHMPEFPAEAITSFNAKEFVDHLERGNVTMVALFSKCHFGNSFYDTIAGHKHAGLPNDFLMEAATECRTRGIFTYAYYSLCSDVRAYLEHENWRWIGRDGEPSGVNGPWARLCLNTPYKDELVIPQLTEVIRRYPVDALWLDIPVAHGTDGCFCPSCRSKYRALHGTDLTTQMIRDDGLSWNFRACTDLIREIRHIMASEGKEFLICSNRSGQVASPLEFTEANDILVCESQPRSNYLSHSFAARYARTLDRPTQVMSVRFYQGWGDLTLKPAAQMTTEFAAMIGNGVAATSGDQVQVDGTLQPAVYDMFAESFGFVEEREEILRSAHTVRDTALLAPVPARDRVAPHANGPAMLGAHKAMVESHLQFDIVNSQHLHMLSDYRTVVLPGPNDYADALLTALTDWVHSGGTLVACDGALLRDGRFAMEDVFGLHYVEPSAFSVSHFKPHDAVRGDAYDLVLQCRGAAHKVVPREARPLADLIYPEGESTPSRAFRNPSAAPPASNPSPYPFATVNDFGEGRAVYIAACVFSTYWRYNHHWLRQFFEALFRHTAPPPLYRVDALPTTEANLMRTEDEDLLLNLIDYQVGHQADRDAIPAIERVRPVHDIRCEVSVSAAEPPPAVLGSPPDDAQAHVRDVVLEPEGRSIPFEIDGDYVSFTIPEMRYLGMARVVLA